MTNEEIGMVVVAKQMQLNTIETVLEYIESRKGVLDGIKGNMLSMKAIIESSDSAIYLEGFQKILEESTQMLVNPAWKPILVVDKLIME